MKFITIPLAGELTHGQPLPPTDEKIMVPFELIEPDKEVVYRVRKGVDGARRGDLLFVELRATASTGELVVAMIGDCVLVGRFWAKHGLRELHRDSDPSITGRFTIIGAVNLIVRGV